MKKSLETFISRLMNALNVCCEIHASHFGVIVIFVCFVLFCFDFDLDLDFEFDFDFDFVLDLDLERANGVGELTFIWSGKQTSHRCQSPKPET